MNESEIYDEIGDVLTDIAIKNKSPSYEKKLEQLSRPELERLLYIRLRESEGSVSEFLEAYSRDGIIYRLRPDDRFYLALRCAVALSLLHTLKHPHAPFCMKQGISRQEILQWLLKDVWDIKFLGQVMSLAASDILRDGY